MRIAVAALVAMALRAAGAQSAPAAGFAATRLQLGTDSLQIYVVRGGETRHVGMLWDELSVEQVGGERRLRRVYRTTNRLFGNSLDTTIATLPAMRTTRHVAVGTANVDLRFGADSVTGVLTSPADGSTRRVAVAIDSTVQDGHMFDVLVRGADLAGDASIAVRAFVYTRDSLAALRARVTGTESVRVEGGARVEAWVVEMDFAGLSSTMWIARTNRRLVRQVIRLGPGLEMLMTPEPSLATTTQGD